MVRIFTVLLLSFISYLPSVFAQQNVTANFNALVWEDDFDGAHPNMWRQTTNAEEVFIIQNGEYILYKKSTNSYGLIFPNEKIAFSAHKAEFNLKLDEDTRKTATVGVVVMAQEDGKGAFLIEINGKRQYRISKYNGVVFKTVVDWTKDRAIKSRGESNVIAVDMEDRKYDLYINNKFITGFSEVSYKEGKVGLYIGTDSKASFDYVRIYVTNEEKEKLRKKMQLEQSKENDPTLTAVITKLREQMVELEIERDSLRVVVEQLKKEVNKNKGSWSVQKLRKENNELSAEVRRLKKENAQLLKENANLKDFKEMVVNGESGDIIITLTKAIETERERVSILAAENEKLQQEIKKLKDRLGN